MLISLKKKNNNKKKYNEVQEVDQLHVSEWKCLKSTIP